MKEKCRNEEEYSKVYDRLTSSVRNMNHEESLRLAHIAYDYVLEERGN